MNNHNSFFIKAILALGILCLSGPVVAGQWKPLCVEGSSCSSPYNVHLGGGPGGYHPIDSHAAGPLVASQGILLHHTPVSSSPPCLSCAVRPNIFQLSPLGMEDLGGGFGFVSDANAVELPGGRKLAFWLQGVAAWYDPEDGIESFNWSGRDTLNFNLTELTGPPVTVGNTIYIGIRGGGAQSIYVSADEALSWIDMSSGLPAQPYTVTYGHGQLMATGESGYFTCNTVDCAGLAQPLPPKEELGIVEVIEFYHSDLDHYFITASETEVTFIEQGLAGKGWVRTGETFLAWSLGSGNPEVTDVCRFYGSIDPGPNSHFYSVSPSECRFLMDLQELIPADQPRWNFEGYAFSMLPPAQHDLQPCPENSTPVYRAYNNGYVRGEDSNHRYVTDLNLLIPLLDKGWPLFPAPQLTFGRDSGH